MQGVFQDGAGDARIDVIQRDEGVEAGDRHRQRQVWVGEADRAEGILALERAVPKARQPFVTAAVVALGFQTEVVDFLLWKGSFHQAGLSASLQVQQGKTGILGHVPVRTGAGGRRVPDREILQTTVAVQADAASADPAQRHGNLQEV